MHAFLAELKKQRWDDHRYYHHSRINQTLHLVSALSFLTAYVFIFTNPVAAALIGWLVAMVTRQLGHFVFESKDYDQVNQATHAHKEDIKVGYNLRRKVVLLSIWGASPLVLWLDPTLFGIFPRDARPCRIRTPRLSGLARPRPGRVALPHGAAVPAAERVNGRRVVDEDPH